MHLEDNLHRYFWGHKGCWRAWSCPDHFEISVSGMWKSASTVLWQVSWTPCAQATGQSLVTCELYQSCPSASLLQRFWLLQLSYLPQPPPCQGYSYKSRSLSSLMQNLGNDTCVCVQGTVRAEEGPTLRKEEELCGRSFWGQGVGAAGEAAGHRWGESYRVLLDWGSDLGPWLWSFWPQGGISPPFLLKSDLSCCLALADEFWIEVVCATSVHKHLAPCVVHFAFSLPLWSWSFCCDGSQVADRQVEPPAEPCRHGAWTQYTLCYVTTTEIPVCYCSTTWHIPTYLWPSPSQW